MAPAAPTPAPCGRHIAGPPPVAVRAWEAARRRLRPCPARGPQNSSGGGGGESSGPPRGRITGPGLRDNGTERKITQPAGRHGEDERAPEETSSWLDPGCWTALPGTLGLGAYWVPSPAGGLEVAAPRPVAATQGEESSFQRIEKDTELLLQPPDLQFAHPRHPKTWQGPLSGPPRPESSGQCPAWSSECCVHTEFSSSAHSGPQQPQTGVFAGVKGGTLKAIYSPLVEEGKAGNSECCWESCACGKRSYPSHLCYDSCVMLQWVSMLCDLRANPHSVSEQKPHLDLISSPRRKKTSQLRLHTYPVRYCWWGQ
nr:uncharacterized protein LOC118967010 [Manis javanica]